MVRRPAVLTRPARLPGPAALQRRFTSPLHGERTASWLGIWLGAAFTTAFATGLISHFMQHPPGWADWPSRPAGLYRVTQGLHVIGGLAAVPPLLAKLWTVYPKLLRWPPVRSAGHALTRALTFALVAGALFQVLTGVLNIAYWYPFPFFFPTAHYWTSYLLAGAMLVHLAHQWPKARRTVMTRPRDAVPAEPPADTAARRAFLATVTAAAGAVTLTTAGETFTPLARLAVLAPRRPGNGPQRLPVNKSAVAAGVTATARDPRWRLTVTGDVHREVTLTLAQLHAMPAHRARLPIACVEGWSAEATWHGVRLRDILRLAGTPDDARVRVESLEPAGPYRTSHVAPPHWHDPLTLLAYAVNGAPLHPDHGHPCRLIAPNRPGVMQTKWVHRLVVLP